MAKRQTKADTTPKYKEVEEVVGDHFVYSIRLYPEAKEHGKVTSYFMYLTINKLVTINCYFNVTADNMWVQMPQYKVKDDYKSYIYLDKELEKDFDKICDECEKLL